MVLCMKNQAADPTNIMKYLKNSVFSLKIKYNTNFQLSKLKENKLCDLENDTTEKEINCFPVLYALLDLAAADPKFYINLKNFKPGKFPLIRKNCASFLTFFSDTKDRVLERLGENQIELSKRNFEIFKERKNVLSSMIDFSSKFENVCSVPISLDDKIYMYNLIEVERIEVLAQKEDPSTLFYFIRLNDKNLLFIAPLKQDSYTSSPNLCHYFYGLYPKLTPIKEETKKKKFCSLPLHSNISKTTCVLM